MALLGHCFPFHPFRTRKLLGHCFPIWLLKVNWRVIAGLQDTHLVFRLLNWINSNKIIVFWDVMPCTTIVEEPAVFVFRLNCYTVKMEAAGSLETLVSIHQKDSVTS